jgi:hypothetical protein
VTGIELIFDELPTGDLLINDTSLIVELEDHLDLLEAQFISHEDLPADVKRFAGLVELEAGLVVNVYLSVDDLAAAPAFHIELVELAGGGGGGLEKFLEEAHG